MIPISINGEREKSSLGESAKYFSFTKLSKCLWICESIPDECRVKTSQIT